MKRRWDQWHHNYDPALGRPSSVSTTAITLDDTTTTGTIFKNGSNRMARQSMKNSKVGGASLIQHTQYVKSQLGSVMLNFN